MLNIRPARKNDESAITKIIKELDLAYPSQSLESFWVAEKDKEIIGIANLENFGGFLFLSSVGITEKEQHKGFAAALLNKILAAEKPVYLYTTIPGFFRPFGFKTTDFQKFLPPKTTFSCRECTPETCVTMIRPAHGS